MIALSIIAFLLFSAGAFFLLELTPDRIAEDFSGALEKGQSLKTQSLEAKGKKHTNKLISSLIKIQRALKESGKERQFSFACASALILMILGCVLALAIDNPFLIPVFCVALALVPFLYIGRMLTIYETQAKEELETALSIVTSSYIRNDDLVTAVRENIVYLHRPIRGFFESFLTEMTTISPDIRIAIQHLKEALHNDIASEWCDTLVACQSDRSLKDTLMPVVSKFTDIRLVNSSLKSMLSESRREYTMMVCLVLANLPLLYFLNKDWYAALVNTTLGKIVLAICGVIILLTAFRMAKLTQPIEYKR